MDQIMRLPQVLPEEGHWGDSFLRRYKGHFRCSCVPEVGGEREGGREVFRKIRQSIESGMQDFVLKDHGVDSFR